MKKTCTFLIFSLLTNFCLAQVKFQTKAEISYIIFNSNTVTVDPGPNWKGYYLEDQNGIGISTINGVRSKNEKFFYGIGLSYLNFEINNSFSIFGEVEYNPHSKKISPIASIRIGYNHLWNQYENGTGTELVDFGIGGNFKIDSKNSFYLKTGALLMQQSLLIPITIGYRFN